MLLLLLNQALVKHAQRQCPASLGLCTRRVCTAQRALWSATAIAAGVATPQVKPALIVVAHHITVPARCPVRSANIARVNFILIESSTDPQGHKRGKSVI